ncbi:MAG: CHASE domain-containing protein, partial [Luteimonas sp.]
QWQSYVDGLDLWQRFPALVGLGYAPYLSSSGLQALQLSVREAGEGLLQVRPHGVRQHYGPILYLEPKSQENLAALGFDMFSEPTRQAAMAAARDSGKPALTGPLHLVQDRGAKVPGVLLYAPVYGGAHAPNSTAARRESMQGWVYVPFRMHRFVETALSPMARRSVWFRLADITGGAARPLYADDGIDEAGAAFTHTVTVETYGRRWRYQFVSGPLAVAAPRLAALQWTLAIGVLASLLLFGIAWALARTEARAHKLADRMTESFRRSELRLRSAMQYSAIGNALLDAGGSIVEVNPAFAQTVGRTPERLAGVVFGALFEGGNNESVRSRENEALAAGVYRTTRRLRRDDGDLRQLQLTYSPVPGDIGQDIARLVQVEDVTERVRAETRVQALNRTLEARVALRTRELTNANEELETFAYSVSHDLRAPLRAIEGFSRLLLERYDPQLDDTGRDYFGRVRKAAARMGELIDALLTMSRLARSELKLADLDLSKLAGDVVQELRDGERDRPVQVGIAPGLRALGDPVLVRNLLQNLIGNAWKFTRGREDARIEIGSTTGADGTQFDSREFFVRDNGAGFSPQYAGKLFRPFQRLHSQEQFAGHGIGLASVKRIVERHGGRI